MENNIKKLKRAIIKEELIAITGNFVEAIILNQFIYWTERAHDFDDFIAQEKHIAEKNQMEIVIEPTCGWVYKTAEELSEETLLGLSRQNMRSHLKSLIKLGYLQERNNPQYKWDKTIQYRVNLVKIQTDLQKLGYCLEGYPLILEKPHNDRCSENEHSNVQKITFDVPKSNIQMLKNIRAIPETTTEINIKEKNIYKKKKPKNEQTKKDPVENKHKYGEYKNVLLSDKDLEKLKSELPDTYQDWIERLSEYIAITGKKYENHLATIRNWNRKEKQQSDKPDQPKQTTKYKILTMDD